MDMYGHEVRLRPDTLPYLMASHKLYGLLADRAEALVTQTLQAPELLIEAPYGWCFYSAELTHDIGLAGERILVIINQSRDGSYWLLTMATPIRTIVVDGTIRHDSRH